MTRYSQIFLAFSSLASIAQADWRFRSRPEFAVPRLNITVPADKTAVEEGYIFIAPYEGFGEGHTGPVQAGAYIYRDDGELVWSGLGYHAGWVSNFRPVTWNGQPHLRAFQGRLDHVQGRMFGFHTLLGSDYEVAKVVTVGSHRLVSAHEFHVVDGKTALIETPIPRTVSLKPWGGDEGQNWVVSAGFQGSFRRCTGFSSGRVFFSPGRCAESIPDLMTDSYFLCRLVEIDIATGEVLFEWESFDHVDPKCEPLRSALFASLPRRTETIFWPSRGLPCLECSHLIYTTDSNP